MMRYLWLKLKEHVSLTFVLAFPSYALGNETFRFESQIRPLLHLYANVLSYIENRLTISILFYIFQFYKPFVIRQRPTVFLLSANTQVPTILNTLRANGVPQVSFARQKSVLDLGNMLSVVLSVLRNRGRFDIEPPNLQSVRTTVPHDSVPTLPRHAFSQ